MWVQTREWAKEGNWGTVVMLNDQESSWIRGHLLVITQPDFRFHLLVDDLLSLINEVLV